MPKYAKKSPAELLNLVKGQDRLAVAHIARIPMDRWTSNDIDTLNRIADKVEKELNDEAGNAKGVLRSRDDF